MVAHGASRGLSDTSDDISPEGDTSINFRLPSMCRPPGCGHRVDIPPRLTPWATFCRPPGYQPVENPPPTGLAPVGLFNRLLLTKD